MSVPGPSAWPGEVVLVTGAGSGIGAAVAARAAADGARHVVVTDLDGDAAARVAAGIGSGASGHALDVTDAAAVRALVADLEATHGRVDTVVSNAGLTTGLGLLGGDDDAVARAWQRAFEVHVLAHLHLARAVLPSMAAAGDGRFVVTASAAGLLLSPGDAPYSVTKHGSVAFAEYLALEHAGDGVAVSVVCPLGVATPLLMDPLRAGDPAAAAVAASGELITAEAVADAVADGVREGRFLVLPHPQVGRFWAQKASDPQRWLAGVRRLLEPGTADTP